MLKPAVYRFQSQDFCSQILALAYARRLGVPHAFLPPVMEANSFYDLLNRHGYDQTHHQKFSAALGGEEALSKLIESVHAAGGHVVVDWVPSHHHDSHRLTQENPSVYDFWFDQTGLLHTANFFGLGWLPKVRLEDPDVFEQTQSFLLDWAQKNGCFLRGDHYDGWQNPAGVISHLRNRGIKLIAERIVAEGQDLHVNDSLLGETGYRYLDWLNYLPYNSQGAEIITSDWKNWADQDAGFRQQVPENTVAEVMQQAKYRAAFLHFDADMERLLIDLRKLGHHEVTKEDIALWSSKLPVYRTYFWHDRQPSQTDLQTLRSTGAPEWFVQHIASGGSPFWQPIMAGIHAKGVEDCGLYSWTPLIGLNEVGSTLSRSGLSVAEFHRKVMEWSKCYPDSWVALNTHDTKRSACVRACLAAATQFPQRHAQTLKALRDRARHYNSAERIGLHAQRFIFDTMLGAWPAQTDRLAAYFIKAFREAGIHTNWWHPDEVWESDVIHFVQAVAQDREFQFILAQLGKRLDGEGRELLLSQQLLGLMIPGTFAFYNGEEGPNNKWLVDPDNRRPANYAQLSELLQQVKAGRVSKETKLMSLIYRALQAQKAAGDFHESQWIPVDAPLGCIAVRRSNLLAVCSLNTGAVKSAKWTGGSRFAKDLLPEQFHRQGLYLLH